jgi:hypothetical protein
VNDNPDGRFFKSGKGLFRNLFRKRSKRLERIAQEQKQVCLNELDGIPFKQISDETDSVITLFQENMPVAGKLRIHDAFKKL